MLKSPRLLSTAIALLGVFGVLSLWHVSPQDHISYFTSLARQRKQDPTNGFKADLARIKDVHNSTLGV